MFFYRRLRLAVFCLFWNWLVDINK